VLIVKRLKINKSLDRLFVIEDIKQPEDNKIELLVSLYQSLEDIF
jgi:hypothetical protein